MRTTSSASANERRNARVTIALHTKKRDTNHHKQLVARHEEFARPQSQRMRREEHKQMKLTLKAHAHYVPVDAVQTVVDLRTLTNKHLAAVVEHKHVRQNVRQILHVVQCFDGRVLEPQDIRQG